jgi:hypothetical protein
VVLTEEAGRGALGDMEFTGEFETHITVSFDNHLDEIDRLQQWCIDRDLKFLHILLDRGVSRSQPMLTRRGQGDFDDELEIATNLAKSLVVEDFPVIRIKIEAAHWNQGVPTSDAEAIAHHANQYFEHHVKLSIESTADLLPLRELAIGHSAHLSRNALQTRNDGFQERFITQRCMNMGRSKSTKQLQILVDEIESLGYIPIDIEAEFVVYDSNLALDFGWIHDLKSKDIALP